MQSRNVFKAFPNCLYSFWRTDSKPMSTLVCACVYVCIDVCACLSVHGCCCQGGRGGVMPWGGRWPCETAGLLHTHTHIHTHAYKHSHTPHPSHCPPQPVR